MPAPSSMSRRRTLRPFGPVWCVTKVLPSNSFANAGTSAPFFVSLTPPALPRPPAWIWAFTTYTGAFSFAAHFSAASGVLISLPIGTGMPNCANNCLAWNSWMFMRGPFSSALFPHIVREQHRRTDRKGARVLPRLGPEPREVLQRQLAVLHGLGALGGRGASPFPEHHEVQERVPHEAVAPVQAAGGLAGHKEVAHAGLTVHVDLHAAVLAAERGVDQHRILRDVEPIALKLADHRREVLLQRAGPVLEIQQRRVQPDADPPRDGADAAALFAFADDRGGDYVARVQLVHEPLALGVDQMAALRPDALGDQRADQLLRVHRAGRVVLEGVDLQQLGPDPVRHRQRVPGRAVVVAGREALDVQAADATRRKDHRLGDHHDAALVIQILKHRARAGPLPIAQQLDGGAELQELDLLIQHFVLQHPHDLEAGIG